VHFDPPTDADTYTHRSGRTGRAGRKGRSLLLVPPAAERRVRILLAAAKIDAQWLPVPDPSQVKKALVKQTRRRLHALLASDARPGDAEIAYAATLLEQHDPATLVATLLGASTAKLPREPMTVSGPRPRPARADGRPPQASFRDRSNGAYVAFTITWGQRAGATPQRLLAQICRRGDVESASVGAIDIGPKGSTFQIAADVARHFEENARRPDARDAKVRIQRAAADDERPTRYPRQRPEPTTRGGPDDRQRKPKTGKARGGSAPPNRDRPQKRASR
jgi:ATP-dependent RNA helicase DeaD